MTNFGFLKPEWPELFDAATKAETSVYPDPRAACFYARRTLEIAVQWLYKNDRSLKLPYQDNLSALIFEPTFQSAVGQKISAKARAHQRISATWPCTAARRLTQYDALTAVRELFHFSFWLARTYGKGHKPADGLTFDPNLLPKTSPDSTANAGTTEAACRAVGGKGRQAQRNPDRQGRAGCRTGKLRAEIAAIKEANEGRPDNHDYNEAETRDYFIDLLLKEAGWPLDKSGTPSSRSPGCPTIKARASWIMSLGRRRQAPRTGRGQAHEAVAAGWAAAGEALCRLPGEAVRPASRDLLQQRLRALAVG